MAAKTQWAQISGYLFLLGVLIAIVSGLAPGAIPAVGTILTVLGAIIGLIAAAGWSAIGKEEADTFLLATIGLIGAGASGAVLAGIPTIGLYLKEIVGNIAALVMPAVVIIALEVIWRLAAVRLSGIMR